MMTNLINDLLDLAKMTNQAFKLDLQQRNLIEVIEQAFDIIVYQADDKKLKLYLMVDKMRPFVFRNVMIDQRRMLQIILNFLSNSMKFTPSGGFIKIHLNVLEEQIRRQNPGPKRGP